MKLLQRIVFILMLGSLISSCKDDDARTCTQCSSPITTEFELCRESDGKASLNGENTGVSYDVYLAGLIAEGVNCD